MKETGNLVLAAQEFAQKVHEHLFAVTISGIKVPQIVHIQQVADLVWAAGGTDEEVMAAWLHDTVEDTDTTIEVIREKFGDAVAEMVEGLTDSPDIEGLPLLERKKLQAEHIATQSDSVKLIKLADQSSNVRSVTLDPFHDMSPDICRDYLEGARLIALQCKGVSPLLDGVFERIYQRGIARHGIGNT